MTARNRGLMGALRRMVTSSADLESADLRRGAEQEGAHTVATCGARERVILRGTIRTVTHPIESEYPRLEADLDDGSGVVTLVWMGRRQVSGIQAGTILRVEGRLSTHQGRLALYNPRYELVQVPGPG
jgi:RecG-like helicase